jgi:2-methylcitrate dehydratase PrpD
MTCTSCAIEGANGLFDVLAPKADRDTVCRDLGGTYSMLQNAYKPYPCGIVVHPVIDACLEFLKTHDKNAVARVDVAVHPVGKHLGDRKFPKTEFEAQVSIAYCVALVLAAGEMTIAHLAEPWRSDARLAQMQEHVDVTADPTIARDAAVVSFTLKDGKRVEVRIDHARGSLDRPMTDEELADKFRAQAEPVTGPNATAKFLEIIMGAPRLNMTRLAELVDTHRASP